MRQNYTGSPRIVDFVTDLLSVSEDDGRAARLQAGRPRDESDWLRAVTFANAHFLTPALPPALRRYGLWDEAPSDVQGYLDDVRDLAKDRTARQRAQAHDTIRVLNGADIVPIVMKSGADLLEGKIEATISSDLDILTSPDQVDRAAAALEGAGFGKVMDGDAHSVGSFARADDVGPIDLHHRPLDGERVLPPTDVMARAISRSEGELRWRRLSPMDEVTHLVLHDQIQPGFHYTGTIDLKNLRRLAELVRRHERDTDWLQLYETFRRFGFGDVFLSQIDAASRYLGAPALDLPTGRMGVRFSRLLRDLRLKNRLASGVIRRVGHLVCSLVRPIEKL